MIKRLAILFLFTMALASCAHLQQPRTLGQVKSDWDCIFFEKGVPWQQVAERFKEPDIAPLPEPGTDLSRNARIYLDKMIIFYMENQEIQEGEKIRFQEVVTGIDLCRKKK